MEQACYCVILVAHTQRIVLDGTGLLLCDLSRSYTTYRTGWNRLTEPPSSWLYHKDGDLTHSAMFKVRIVFFYLKGKMMPLSAESWYVFSRIIFCASLILSKKYIHIISCFTPTGLRKVSNCNNTTQKVYFTYHWPENTWTLLPLQKKTTGLLETSGSNYPVQYCHIPQERIIRYTAVVHNIRYHLFIVVELNLISPYLWL